MAVKLTKTFIESLKPGAKEAFYWDTEAKGFGLKISSRGRISYLVQGRVDGSDKSARITIGTHGVFTVEQAREAAREHLRTMRRGEDPRELKRQKETLELTLRQIGNDYMARPGKLKPRSREIIERHLSTTFEAWQHKPIATITVRMCRTRYREILTKGLRGKKGAPGQANQAFSVLSGLINYASRQHRRADGSPLIPFNPVAVLKDDRVRLRPRSRRILDHRVGACWLALRQWRWVTYNHSTLSGIDLVRFLLLTGLRIGEASTLRWDQVKLEDGFFDIPDPKNGNPVSMPLSSQATLLLGERDRERIEGNPFVFPSWSGSGHVVSPPGTMKRLGEVAGNKLAPHDLRRTYTNIGLRQCRIEKFRVDLLTNHITKDVTTEHYFDTTNLQWLQPEAQMIGDFLDREADRVAEEQCKGLNEHRLLFED
ncbi:tyrosine-type recombinase/integrase [Sphingomonas sp. OTU376]|uniref:tyrosine-type recombinase/integrase n=1 Tax=Sphingomonas sp. OTU376 TaxID=3043863 RepID=UPI00313B549F